MVLTPVSCISDNLHEIIMVFLEDFIQITDFF